MTRPSYTNLARPDLSPYKRDSKLTAYRDELPHREYQGQSRSSTRPMSSPFKRTVESDPQPARKMQKTPSRGQITAVSVPRTQRKSTLSIREPQAKTLGQKMRFV